VGDALRNVRLYTMIKDLKSPLKGSRPSVPHGTNISVTIYHFLVDTISIRTSKTHQLNR